MSMNFSVFPELPNVTVGSHRIYALNVPKALENLGFQRRPLGSSNLVMVAKGHLADFARSGYFRSSTEIIMTTPDMEILALPQMRKNVRCVLVPSFEEREFWIEQGFQTFIVTLDERLKRKIFSYPSNEVVDVVYQGNLEHLKEMRTPLLSALRRFQDSHGGTFIAHYDMERLGQWRAPSGLRVAHRQWELSSLTSNLTGNQVAFAPGLQRHSTSKKIKIFSGVKFNTVSQYKRTSNFGRVAFFQQLGIPVIAEGYPSAFAAIPTPEYGEVIFGEASLFLALERFKDGGEREVVADNAHRRVNKELSMDWGLNRMKSFLQRTYN